jgi:hypothetical protein
MLHLFGLTGRASEEQKHDTYYDCRVRFHLCYLLFVRGDVGSKATYQLNKSQIFFPRTELKKISIEALIYKIFKIQELYFINRFVPLYVPLYIPGCHGSKSKASPYIASCVYIYCISCNMIHHSAG